MKSRVESYNVLLSRNKKIKKINVKKKNYINISDGKNILIIDDVINALKRIPDKSISTVVTSPPYWNLRDYKNEEQIGNELSPDLFVKKMVEIGNEILRVLKDDGAYFLNIGDTYVNQSLQMIPQKIAIEMQKYGWLIRNQIVWYKPNHMPSPVKKRFSNTYEVIFFFTKNDWEKEVYFDIDSIRVPHKSSFKEQLSKNVNDSKFYSETKNLGASPAARMVVNGNRYIVKRNIIASQKEICNYLLSYMKKINISKSGLINILGNDYKYKVGHWFRLDAGRSYPSKNDWIKLKKILKFCNKYDKQMTEEYTELQSIKAHPKGRNPGDLFISNTAKSKYKHYAVFPESIPELAIKSTCPQYGIVLDPFAGTGTTGVVAQRMKRQFVLIDIQRDFAHIIKERLTGIKIV